jgi:hypothetical protein
MRGVKDNGINRDVSRGLIIVQMVNVRQPNLQLVIAILDKKWHMDKDLRLGLVSKKNSNLSFLDI